MGYKVSKKGHRNCSRNTGYKSHIIPFTILGPHSEGKVRVRVSKTMTVLCHYLDIVLPIWGCPQP